jgi:nitroreductase
MMDVFEAVRTVLAVRACEDKPIPPEVTRKIVEAAYLTGSSRNGQPWHFIVVEDRAVMEKMAGLAVSGPYIRQAPMAVVVATEESEYAMSDASRAIQSMMLVAWAEGVGSNWVGFGHFPDDLNTLLGIPQDITVQAIIPFGYPSQAIGKGKKSRKPFADLVHRERFGQPFA